MTKVLVHKLIRQTNYHMRSRVMIMSSSVDVEHFINEHS